MDRQRPQVTTIQRPISPKLATAALFISLITVLSAGALWLGAIESKDQNLEIVASRITIGGAIGTLLSFLWLVSAIPPNCPKCGERTSLAKRIWVSGLCPICAKILFTPAPASAGQDGISTVRCANCRSRMLKRPANGSVQTTRLGPNTHAQYRTEVICPICDQLPCAVEGCRTRSSVVIPHEFTISKGINVPNEYAVCRAHRAVAWANKAVRIISVLVSIGILLWLIEIEAVVVSPVLLFGIRFLPGLATGLPKKRKPYGEIVGDRYTWNDPYW